MRAEGGLLARGEPALPLTLLRDGAAGSPLSQPTRGNGAHRCALPQSHFATTPGKAGDHMSDRGIINNRKASVTFTVEIDGVRRDSVIKPGANRLSAAQYAALQNHPLFRKMFEPIDAVERMS